MNKKFKLSLEDKLMIDGRALYRIIAESDFAYVKKGDKGGYIEKESNLAQDEDCWVYNNARVYGNALVYGDARVYGNASVYGNALVCGNVLVCRNAEVSGNARVYGNSLVDENARVYGNALVYGNAHVYGNALVYGNAVVYGDACVYDNMLAKDSVVTVGGLEFTITKTTTHLAVGCKAHRLKEWRELLTQDLNLYSAEVKGNYAELRALVETLVREY